MVKGIASSSTSYPYPYRGERATVLRVQAALVAAPSPGTLSG